FLYSVHGDGDYATAFMLNGETGQAKLLNRGATGGNNGVRQAVDPTGKFLIVANYGSGNSTARPQPTVGTPSAARLRLFKSLPRCLRISPATAQRPKLRSRRTVALCIAPIAATTAWLCTPPMRETDCSPRLDGSPRKAASHASLVSTRQGAFSMRPTSRTTQLSHFE